MPETAWRSTTVPTSPARRPSSGISRVKITLPNISKGTSCLGLFGRRLGGFGLRRRNCSATSGSHLQRDSPLMTCGNSKEFGDLICARHRVVVVVRSKLLSRDYEEGSGIRPRAAGADLGGWL